MTLSPAERFAAAKERNRIDKSVLGEFRKVTDAMAGSSERLRSESLHIKAEIDGLVSEISASAQEQATGLNEVNAEVAKLRDGSDLREATAKAKKAEGDLEQASASLREANAKLTEATTKLAALEEEIARLKADVKGFDNPSPNYRAR